MTHLLLELPQWLVILLSAFELGFITSMRIDKKISSTDIACYITFISLIFFILYEGGFFRWVQ